MQNTEEAELVAHKVQVVRLLIIGLWFGVLIAMVMVFVVAGGATAAMPPGLLTTVGLLASLPSLVMALILPRIIGNSAVSMLIRTAPDQPRGGLAWRQRLLNVWQSSTIVGVALLEGAALINVILFLAERHVISLIAAAVLAGGMAAFWPTINRAADWLEARLREPV
jgi:hypothetical protein